MPIHKELEVRRRPSPVRPSPARRNTPQRPEGPHPPQYLSPRSFCPPFLLGRYVLLLFSLSQEQNRIIQPALLTALKMFGNFQKIRRTARAVQLRIKPS